MRRCGLWISRSVRVMLLVLAGPCLSLQAQQQEPPEQASEDEPALLRVRLGQERDFYVRAQAVDAVSLHRYLVPPYEVVEMVVDAGSGIQLRIYAMEAARAQDLQALGLEAAGAVAPEVTLPRRELPEGVKEAAGRARQAAGTLEKQVVKVYPATTHARTVEYAMASHAQVRGLYSRFAAALVAEGGAGDELRVVEIKAGGD